MKINMQHSEQTIHRLAKVQYDTYCMHQKLMTLLISVVLLVLGTLNCFNETTSLVLIAIGCFTFTGMNAPATRNAKKMIEYAKGDFPASEYVFGEDSVEISGDGKKTILRYSEIFGLICDGAYLYLFINRFSAYMVPVNALEREAETELKELLSEKTGLPIEKPGSLLYMNLRSIRKGISKKK